MVHPIKVNIAGRDYSLYGDDEDIIRQSAGMVDEQIKQMKKTFENEPLSTVSILAALNIAEEVYKNRHQSEVDFKYIMSEITKMAEFLKSNLN